MTGGIRHINRYRGYNIRELAVGRVLARQAARIGDKVFLTWLPDGRRWTYGDIERQSNALANGLLAKGIGKGAHVAVLMEKETLEREEFEAIVGKKIVAS